jgi:serine/threonine-protein kinase HipA
VTADDDNFLPEELATLVPAACEDVAERIAAFAGDPTAVLDRIIHSVHKRCRRIEKQVRDRNPA